jgi:hypothetical protein
MRLCAVFEQEYKDKQIFVCNVCNSANDVNYTDNILCDVLQVDFLGETDQDKTL